ncbi:MAG: site-2 protease family protein [Treponema sp.]|nr:site-2 protease family protein [Treponema sp.]
MGDFDLVSKLYSIPGIVLGLTLHEYCHALAAYKLGDETAKTEGRITFNPLKHIDPLGFIFILFAGFGWAKPVSFHPENLSHPRRDKALIAAAGPLSNLALGLLSMLLLKYAFPIIYGWKIPASIMSILTIVFFDMALINLGLFVFNILPLPPLDGSHIFLAGLNLKPETENKIYRYGTIVLFAIIILENVLHYDIIPIGKFTSWVFNLFFPS